MTDDRPLAHKRLARFDVIDEIAFRTIPRYKTSSRSGDEWRHHVQVELRFKGKVVAEYGCSDMDAAIAMLGAKRIQIGDEGVPDAVIAAEASKCDQPSCQNDAIGRLAIKRHAAADGHWLDAEEYSHHRWYRQFCAVHIQRGDCSREDCDANYEPIDGVSADASTNTQKSPAAVVYVNAPDVGA